MRDACGVWRQLCQAQSLKILKVNYSKSIYVVEHRVCPCDLHSYILIGKLLHWALRRHFTSLCSVAADGDVPAASRSLTPAHTQRGSRRAG